MIATCYEQNRFFRSSSVQLRVKPLHQNIEESEKPTIDVRDEESTNPVLKQVLHDLRRAQMQFGTHHQKSADAWNALGLIRVHMQRDAEAARICHEYALTIFQEQQMAKETATTLNDLGYCCEQLNLPETALKNYQDSLKILESENFPENHPQLLSTRRAVSRILRK
jgi:tetratricopeptide (TPR) repeat protein